jgi:hypothetical protein
MLNLKNKPKLSQELSNQTKLFELKRKIAKTFGVQTAEELAYKTTYTELAAGMVVVKLGEGIKLTEYNKELLRDCVKAIYGENVQIVTNKRTHKLSSPVTNIGNEVA